MLFGKVDKTTVILANCGKIGPQVKRIPTYLLRTWQRWVVLTFFTVVVLVGTLCLFIYQSTSRDYQARLDRANYIRSQIDVEQIRSSFMAIDSGIHELNLFLTERGLTDLMLPDRSIGGIAEDMDVTDIASVGVFYEGELSSIHSLLQTIPIGFPHKGRITSRYGWRRNPFGRRSSEFHRGIDLKGCVGDTVRTTASGVVKESEYKSGYGNCVVVQHSDSLLTLYAHLSSRLVRVGQEVDSGQAVGLLGNTGRSTGSHLHYEVMRKGRRVNPAPYLLL